GTATATARAAVRVNGYFTQASRDRHSRPGCACQDRFDDGSAYRPSSGPRRAGLGVVALHLPPVRLLSRCAPRSSGQRRAGAQVRPADADAAGGGAFPGGNGAVAEASPGAAARPLVAGASALRAAREDCGWAPRPNATWFSGARRVWGAGRM